MKKAIIYIPNKNPMQSGLAKNDKWILEFKTKDPTKNPLMGWESSSDTYTELKLEKTVLWELMVIGMIMRKQLVLMV